MIRLPNLRTTLPIAAVASLVWLALLALGQAQQSKPRTEPDASRGSASAHPTDEMGVFVSKILWSTEQVWQAKFREAGKRYEKPRLVLYNNQTSSACGMGAAVMGPFYCPTDRKVYLDTSFFHALDLRYDAPGNFARAYVIAHEVGHHVQALLGIEKRVYDAQSRMPERDANQLNVRLELQADCLAGIWASWLRQLPGVMEPGDIEGALRATQALGDDMVQKQTTGTVVLDSFTHGTGDQRARWFKRGLDTGKLQQCDTFSAPEL